MEFVREGLGYVGTAVKCGLCARLYVKEQINSRELCFNIRVVSIPTPSFVRCSYITTAQQYITTAKLDLIVGFRKRS